MFEKRKSLERKYKSLCEQVGIANRKILELESEVKKRTVVNKRKTGGLGGVHYIFFGDNAKPEVTVVDAVQLILDHLGLEIIENDKLSLVDKEESNG